MADTITRIVTHRREVSTEQILKGFSAWIARWATGAKLAEDTLAGPDGDVSFRLLGQVVLGGHDFHVTALRVKEADDGEQLADFLPGVDYGGGWADELSDWHDIDEAYWRPVAFADIEYVVLIRPFVG